MKCRLSSLLRYALGAACIILASCDSPKTCFDRAVLNCNMLQGFAGQGMLRQLEMPSAKLIDAKTLASAPMKRSEVVADKITFVEESLEKVRALRQTADTRDVVQASLALHEFVLPVYRNEYQQLAKLYDNGAPKAEIDALAAAITAKYQSGFQSHVDRLTSVAKPYAAKHGIKVVWDVPTSPSR